MFGKKDYGPCKRNHGPEFRTLDDCRHDRHHRSELEIERDEKTKLDQGHAKHSWSVEFRSEMKDGLRQWRVFHMAQGEHDWDGPSQGLDTPRWQGKAVNLRKSVMPSQAGRDVRSCSGKLRRAEFYGPRWHRKQGATRGSSAEVNQDELRKLMEELRG